MPPNEPMLREGSLRGKIILITGGGTGLGKAMTRHFMELGAQAIICSRKMDVLEKTAEELREATGGKILPLECDVRNHQEVDEVVAEGEKQFGKIDVLVNNAAGNFISPTERLSVKAFDTIVGIVLQGTYNCTLNLGKKWIENHQPGTVLNIVTTYASTGSGYVVPSACAKAGVLALTRSLASEWGKYGIRHNAIAPGLFPTKGAMEGLLPENMRDKMDPAKKVPLGRVGEHQELTNLAAYLVSDYAGFMNGEVVTIDGGEWLKGAGQFNHLDMLSSEMWDQIEQLTKQGNKK